MPNKLVIDCSLPEGSPDKVQIVLTSKEEDAQIAADAVVAAAAKTVQVLAEQGKAEILAKLQAGSATPAELQKAVAASLGAPVDLTSGSKLADKLNAFLAT